MRKSSASSGLTLVEVTLSLGIVAIGVLSVFAFLTVANDTNRLAREEAFSAQIAGNELGRLRALSPATTPSTYGPRYYDADIRELASGATPPADAVYIFEATAELPNGGTRVVNAEVRHPAQAPEANQKIVRFTTVMQAP